MALEPADSEDDESHAHLQASPLITAPRPRPLLLTFHSLMDAPPANHTDWLFWLSTIYLYCSAVDL